MAARREPPPGRDRTAAPETDVVCSEADLSGGAPSAQQRATRDPKSQGSSGAQDRDRTGDPRVAFRVTLVAEPNVDPIQSLRAALKVLRRRYGLRCTAAREVAE